jgi:hypothetical protein
LDEILIFRIKDFTNDSIEEKGFKDFKVCMEELSYMNQQYLVFKEANKTSKNKTQKFNDFYEEKLNEKQSNDANKDSNSINDIDGSVFQNQHFLELTEDILPEKIPEKINIVDTLEIVRIEDDLFYYFKEKIMIYFFYEVLVGIITNYYIKKNLKFF